MGMMIVQICSGLNHYRISDWMSPYTCKSGSFPQVHKKCKQDKKLYITITGTLRNEFHELNNNNMHHNFFRDIFSETKIDRITETH